MNLAPTKLMRSRLYFWLFPALMIFSCYVCYKLFDTAVLKSEFFSAIANDQHQDSFVINANRGSIYDRNGKVLAQSTTVWNIIISPGDIHEYEAENKEFICKKLSEILDVDYKKLIDACENTKNRYYIVKKGVGKAEVDSIYELISKNNLKSTSIIAIEDSERSYPNSTLASNVLGFTNSDNEGVYGIEAYYDEYLQGVDGRIVTVKDAGGDAMPYENETRYAAENGNSLVLTIDETLQYYLEKNLETTISQHDVQSRGTGIIMNAKTGAVLAMATTTSYDPNTPSTIYSDKDKEILAKLKAANATETEIEKQEGILREQQWKNKAVSELYYPGSVFKVITCSAALEEEKVDLHSSFHCAGSVNVAGTRIRCWNQGGHGTLDLTAAMIKSCNPAFIAIGQSLGVNKFCQYFKAFGFTERTGIDLPGEAQSLYVKEENMGIVELSSSAFGQTNKITPIQMITAFTAAINGGKLVTPYLVEKILDNDGNVVKTTEPTIKRQVISEETSEQMRGILETVVTSNGGSNAYISGYKIGGKSGTSEKIDTYSNEDMMYVATFCAFVPADDPEIVMLVIIDEPNAGQIYGSAVAAPVVSAVFKEGLEYLNIYAQYTAEELENQDTTVPYVAGSNSLNAEASLRAYGLEAEIIGDTNGTVVTGQIPSSGAIIPKNGKVILYMGDISMSDYKFATVPSVIGKTVAEANEIMTNAGLNIRLLGGATNNDSAKATMQSFAEGDSLYRGSVVDVTFIVDDETG